MISLHRSLVDNRHPECRVIKWFDPLPKVSVIIIFHNEAWSTLLRTIHSVIDRSDPKLLTEILLVDDCSDLGIAIIYFNIFTNQSPNSMQINSLILESLKDPLQNYIDKLKNVKILRSKERVGLIRARLIGTAAAKAEVLVFLDSHCECADGIRFGNHQR